MQTKPSRGILGRLANARGAGAVLGMALAVSAGVQGVSAKTVGYLYTSLNGEDTNQVIAFARKADGTLGKQRAYSTKSAGGANIAAGGDARGDFDSQGAIQIVDNKLLVVNAGGNTISVFDLNRKNGALNLMGNTDSQGARPVSLAVHKRGNAAGAYWVVVGNQWNNPNSQKGGAGEPPLEQYPNADFHNTGHTAVLDERNISLFAFDSGTGKLEPKGRLDTYNGTNGGPTTVAFNHDGSKLAVATWGIAHFMTETPTKQKPSRVYVYDFDAKSGKVSNRRHFEKAGVAGSIGFDWDKKHDVLYVSNFNLNAGSRDHSLTVLEDKARILSLVQNFGTGAAPGDIDEACWTAFNPAGDKLYVSSFGGNLISVFDVANGRASIIGSGPETAYTLRKEGTPPGDTKDMLVTQDGHLYALGAFQTFTMSSYTVGADGVLELKGEYPVKAAKKTGAGVYNFLGLAGFDL